MEIKELEPETESGITEVFPEAGIEETIEIELFGLAAFYYLF